MRFWFSPYVLLLITTSSWAGNVIVGRAFHQDIPPLTLTFWRWGIAGTVMLPFVAHQIWQHRALIRQHWRLLFILAATGVALFHACLYIAVNTTTAINAGLLYSLMPIAIPVSSYLMYRERVTGAQVFGISVAMIGMTIIVMRAELDVLLGLQFTEGDLWMLGVVASWAVYSPLLKRLPAALPPMVMLTVIAWLGLLLLLPFYAWEASTVGGFRLDIPNMAALLFVGVVGSVVAYLCWNRAVSLIGANRAIVFIYLIPVFTVFMAIVLLGEEIRIFHVVGTIFICAGILLVMRAGSSAGNTH